MSANVHPIVAALKQRRLEIGMTQVEVARKLFVAKPGISMLESGRRRPAIDTIAGYAEAVGLRLVLDHPPGPRADRLDVCTRCGQDMTPGQHVVSVNVVGEAGPAGVMYRAPGGHAHLECPATPTGSDAGSLAEVTS